MNILKSIHGRRLGLGGSGELIFANSGGTQRIMRSGTRVVNVTASTLTVTKDSHEGATVTLNRAAGIAVSLPAATGSGDKYRFVIGTTITSNSTVFSKNGTDVFQGNVFGVSDDTNAVLGWKAAANSNTLTMDGSTLGGLIGDVVEFEDVKSGAWQVVGLIAQTGIEATPFSHV